MQSSRTALPRGGIDPKSSCRGTSDTPVVHAPLKAAVALTSFAVAVELVFVTVTIIFVSSLGSSRESVIREAVFSMLLTFRDSKKVTFGNPESTHVGLTVLRQNGLFSSHHLHQLRVGNETLYPPSHTDGLRLALTNAVEVGQAMPDERASPVLRTHATTELVANSIRQAKPDLQRVPDHLRAPSETLAKPVAHIGLPMRVKLPNHEDPWSVPLALPVL